MAVLLGKRKWLIYFKPIDRARSFNCTFVLGLSLNSFDLITDHLFLLVPYNCRPRFISSSSSTVKLFFSFLCVFGAPATDRSTVELLFDGPLVGI